MGLTNGDRPIHRWPQALSALTLALRTVAWCQEIAMVVLRMEFTTLIPGILSSPSEDTSTVEKLR